MICSRCGGKMKPGKAIAQTYCGTPDFPDGEVVTISPEGPGQLVNCLKCEKCGHSVTPNVQGQGEDTSAACGRSPAPGG